MIFHYSEGNEESCYMRATCVPHTKFAKGAVEKDNCINSRQVKYKSCKIAMASIDSQKEKEWDKLLRDCSGGYKQLSDVFINLYADDKGNVRYFKPEKKGGFSK